LRGGRGGRRRAQRERRRHPVRGRVRLPALGGRISIFVLDCGVPSAPLIGGRAADWACAREVGTTARCWSTRRRVRRMGMMARIWMWILTQIWMRRGRGGCLDAREGEESCAVDGAEGGEGWGMSCVIGA
jgi:hypothetical protein